MAGVPAMLAMPLWVAVEVIGSVAARDIALPQLEWLRYVFHLVRARLAWALVGYVVLWSLDLALRPAPPSRTAVFLFFRVPAVKFLTAAGDVDFRSRSLWLGTALI